MDGKIYAIRDGFFDVLVWQDSTWINLYHGHYCGYNFGAKIFTRNNTIYALGGYGYWKIHSHLLKFNQQQGSWEMVPISHEPRNYYSYCVGMKGDTIISIFGEDRKESAGVRKHANTGFMLNLKTKKWSKVYYNKAIEPADYLDIANWFIDLKDYTIFETDRQTLLGIYIINKRNLSVSYWDRNELTLNLSPFVFASGNTITYQKKFTGLVTLNFDRTKDNAKVLGTIHTDQPIDKYYVGVIPLLVILISLGFLWNKNKKQISVEENNPDAPKENLDRLTEKILDKKGDLIDTTMIDQLLEISTLSYDNRRVKRAKLISEINTQYRKTHGIDLIHRKKSDTDKRFIQYFIGEKH